MRVEVRTLDDVIVAVADRKPECGEDFCDTCGDCLSCYGSECTGHAPLWILYVDEDAERIAELAIVVPSPNPADSAPCSPST